MNEKNKILIWKKVFKSTLPEAFEVACEDAYRILDDCPVSIEGQRRVRAKSLAYPLASVWIGLQELVLEISNDGSDRA